MNMDKDENGTEYERKDLGKGVRGKYCARFSKEPTWFCWTRGSPRHSRPLRMKMLPCSACSPRRRNALAWQVVPADAPKRAAALERQPPGKRPHGSHGLGDGAFGLFFSSREEPRMRVHAGEIVRMRKIGRLKMEPDWLKSGRW